MVKVQLLTKLSKFAKKIIEKHSLKKLEHLLLSFCIFLKIFFFKKKENFILPSLNLHTYDSPLDIPY